MTVGLLVRTVTVFVTTTKKKGGEDSSKRFFSNREERIFLIGEKERMLSPEQLSVQARLFRAGWWGWQHVLLISHPLGGVS